MAISFTDWFADLFSGQLKKNPPPAPSPTPTQQEQLRIVEAAMLDFRKMVEGHSLQNATDRIHATRKGMLQWMPQLALLAVVLGTLALSACAESRSVFDDGLAELRDTKLAARGYYLHKDRWGP